jgi:two-component system capsular synthesis sensor histidine kinase RcsC
MNGHMRMVSEPGLGSSFTLTLPLEVACDTGETTVPHSLLAEVIYVVSPIRELAESIAGWLRRWGARAQIGCPAETCAPRTQVLLELHPGSVEQHLQPHWSGPRILVSSNGCSEPRHEHGIWYVNLNHLNAIHQAVSQAQGLRATTNDEHTKQQEMRRLDLHVLVAEDNVINQLILRDQLEELGCTVVLASDGDEALQRWKPGQFDMILSDVNMPRMNGYALTRELRRQGCSVPIIGATANAMRGEEDLCMAAGMNGCLVKPFTLQTLLNCLAPYQRKHP